MCPSLRPCRIAARPPGAPPRGPALWLSLVALLVLLGGGGCIAKPARLADFDPAQPARRLDNLSPWYPIDEQDVELVSDYCVANPALGTRQGRLEIPQRAMKMIDEAEDFVIFCFFLFDNLYAPTEAPGDLVGAITDAMIARKAQRPELPVVLILDRMHDAWGNRTSEVIEQLTSHGVDVFYSDVLDTRAAGHLGIYETVNHVGRALNPLTWGMLGRLTRAIGSIPIPGASFDGAPVTLNTIGHALYLKGCHRKVLVTGAHGDYQALVTSWNPHNPSAWHVNHGLVVRGEVARYIYMVMRQDIARSIELGGDLVRWSAGGEDGREDLLARRLPPIESSVDASRAGPPAGSPRAAFATESAIEALILEMLEDVRPDDEVRIQLFYLSRPPVIEAILGAARRTRMPIRVLLDTNRQGIHYAKNGTPNTQAARYMMERAQREGLRLDIRWHASSGEQNHAKAMTITDARRGRYRITVGSANWTRKNLAGINLEANLFVDGVPHINHQFNDLFDRMWYNREDGIVYSRAFDDPALHSADPWTIEWAMGVWFPGIIPPDEPILLERDMVHW
jgi:hypothetical protein